jgi:hypothetical protein
MSTRVHRLCTWSGIAMAVLTAIGAVLIGRFIPPFMSPADTATVVAERYAEHANRVRLGAIVSALGLTLIVPFGAEIAARTRRLESSRPVLTYIQVASIAIASVFVVLTCTIWALTAFRPTQYPPEIVRYSNDLAYFLFIFTWPPFTVWFLAVAAAALGEHPRPAFPRWSGYLSIWLAVQIAAGSLIPFFTTGPFAYNGLFALYLPVALFFAWVVAMTVVLHRGEPTEASEASLPVLA